jgi:LPXTG-motif cell wall-anchored protein
MAEAAPMTGLVATMMSIAVLAAFALAIGGLWLLIKRRDRKQGVLMLLAAIVTFINVLIWTLPPL